MKDFLTGVAIIGVIILTISLMFLQPIEEAKAFNRFSKTKITWWDAIWADYRILPDK